MAALQVVRAHKTNGKSQRLVGSGKEVCNVVEELRRLLKDKKGTWVEKRKS